MTILVSSLREDVPLFLRGLDRLGRAGRGRVDLRIQVVGEIDDILRRADHGRHEAAVG